MACSRGFRPWALRVVVIPSARQPWTPDIAKYKVGSAFTTYDGGAVKRWNAAFLTHAAHLVNQKRFAEIAAPENSRPIRLAPFQRALLVKPQISDEQNPEEYQHGGKRKEPHMRRHPPLVQNRPGDQ